MPISQPKGILATPIVHVLLKLNKQKSPKEEGQRGHPLVYGFSIEFLTIPNQNLEF